LAFVDETTIEVSSGHGGSGAATFRREKYVPKGGPDGGDGGRGGDVIFAVKDNLKTLSKIALRHHFKADDGQPGQKRKRHGGDGRSVVIEVPPGTLIRSAKDGRIIKDLTGSTTWTFLEGGKGGKGNVHFASSTRQAPRYAQPGLPGETATIRLELNLVADLGFVGKPNAGKSTLLSVLTNAKPEIADYPFTTKVPNLGVMKEGYAELILADIPGLIEGASRGVGLGIRFLKHITRTTSLVFLIDLSDEDFLEAFPLLLQELTAFGRGLEKKRRIIVGTKADLPEADKNIEDLRRGLPEEEILSVSSVGYEGIDKLRQRLVTLVEESGNGRRE
jgi:GTP-binding protein